MMARENFAHHHRQSRRVLLILRCFQGNKSGITSLIVTTAGARFPMYKLVQCGLKTKSGLCDDASVQAPPNRHRRLCFNNPVCLGRKPGAGANALASLSTSADTYGMISNPNDGASSLKCCSSLLA